MIRGYEILERIRMRSPLSRLIFICLIGFVCSAPFSISVTQIFVYTGIAAWAFLLFKEFQWNKMCFPLWKPIAVFATLTLLSALFSDDPIRSLKDSRQLFQILIFFFVIHSVWEEGEAFWLVKLLLTATSIASFYSVGVAMTRQLDLAHRVSGFFSIYMTLGSFLVVVGGLTLAYAVLNKNKKDRWCISIVGLFILAALMTTFSRNAWFGIAAAAAFVVIVVRSWKWASLMVAVVVVAILLSPEVVQERVKSVGNLRDVTAKERVLMWRSGLQMIEERPVVGFGLDMIKLNYTRYADPSALKQRAGHLHNNLLQIAAERGVPALAAWIWIWASFYITGYRNRILFGEKSLIGKILTVGGYAAITGFLAAGMFEYNFGDSEVVMTAYFAMALPFIREGRRAEISESL